MKLLRTRVVFGGTYVNEHALLFEGVHSTMKYPREDVSFQARWTFRDIFKHRTIENIDAPVDNTRGFASRLL